MFAEKNTSETRVILVDDDPIFGRLMAKIAEVNGIKLDYFDSMESVGFVANFNTYNVAILDYDLGNETGLEIAGIVPHFIKDLPVVIVSQTNRTEFDSRFMPNNVNKFLLKERGGEKILSEAVSLAKKTS
ncbi:MAG: hypothetical protein CMP10_12210 [Zetaproteobacteria bacterium]|nr:hypothetical protein [Pseudobdellovibrionaceae bacterium]|tara:strand:+ start:866 stop:1255 length:390 start_codon:yes stop_codon:yes gene_type:complete